jgi:hypothetical protein
VSTESDDIVEVVATLVTAIGEASARANAGVRNVTMIDLLERIRELHIVLLELLLIAEPNVDEKTRGLATALGNSIDRLQEVLRVGESET